MIGLHGLLPAIEGATLKSMLAAIVDRHWRAEHPDRAPMLGGHGGDAHEQRMADALLELAGIEAFGPTETSDGSGQNDATADPAHHDPSDGGPEVPANELQRRRTTNARSARARSRRS